MNKYMDLWKEQPDNLAYKAKAEKYAKIISKTIITSGMENTSFGQNAFFYDAAEGLLTASILLVAEFCPPETRHIVSVFKIIQDLLAPSKVKGKSQFQLLINQLPEEHKARWFAGAALNTSEQAMSSVMSTALSRLNTFLDSELEQILCFDTAIDAEKFCNNKSAMMIERALMTPDELKSLPKGTFVVTKTGAFPMQVRLKLFFKWGIVFPDQLYEVSDKGNRAVSYARKEQLQKEMAEKYPTAVEEVAEQPPQKVQRDKHFQKPRNNGRRSDGGAVMSETNETGGESIEGIRDDLSGRGFGEGGDDFSVPAGQTGETPELLPVTQNDSEG